MRMGLDIDTSLGLAGHERFHVFMVAGPLDLLGGPEKDSFYSEVRGHDWAFKVRFMLFLIASTGLTAANLDVWPSEALGEACVGAFASLRVDTLGSTTRHRGSKRGGVDME